jgi:hypothetical protein
MGQFGDSSRGLRVLATAPDQRAPQSSRFSPSRRLGQRIDPKLNDCSGYFLPQRCQIANLLRDVSAVLGSNVGQLGTDVCLHLLKRPEQFVKLCRAHRRSKREQGAAGKRSAAKGTLKLYEAQVFPWLPDPLCCRSRHRQAPLGDAPLDAARFGGLAPRPAQCAGARCLDLQPPRD